MDAIENIWDKTRKVAKLVWRHFFTMTILSLSTSILIAASLNWKNALISLSIAITIDWAKQFIKLTPNSRRHYERSEGHTRSPNTLHDQWSNPNVRGTPAYLMRHSNDH